MVAVSLKKKKKKIYARCEVDNNMIEYKKGSGRNMSVDKENRHAVCEEVDRIESCSRGS